MIPVPAGEEVAPKLLRLLCFITPAVLCTAAINKWKRSERNPEISKEQQQQQHLNGSSADSRSDLVNKAVE